MKTLNTIKRVLKAVWETVTFALGFKGDIRKEAVEAGICDYSGEGRNEHGK